MFLGMDLGGGNFVVSMSKPVRTEVVGRYPAKSLSQIPLPVPMSAMCGEVIVVRYCWIESGSKALFVRRSMT